MILSHSSKYTMQPYNPKLHKGQYFYGATEKSTIELIDPVRNSGLRLALGAF